MTFLLDAQVVLWWASAAAKISDRARELIADGSTVALVSAAALYEITIKARIGRLDLPAEPQVYLPQLLRRHAFGVLPIEEAHALRAGALPLVDRDPWDRLIVAQAQVESIPIITADPAIGQYDVEVVW